jgi:hypothetical protein
MAAAKRGLPIYRSRPPYQLAPLALAQSLASKMSAWSVARTQLELVPSVAAFRYRWPGLLLLLQLQVTQLRQLPLRRLLTRLLLMLRRKIRSNEQVVSSTIGQIG